MTSKFGRAAGRRQGGGTFRADRDRATRRAAASGLAAIAVAGLVAACGSAGGSAGGGSASAGQGSGAGSGQATGSGGAMVSARKLAGVGTVLVDRSGKTLYTPRQEANGKISCTGGCLGFWFPVKVPPGADLRAAAGITGVLGKIHRGDDGVNQLTYNGKPLYTFQLDHAPGQAHGNNFTDRFGGQSFTWHALTASGATAGAGQASSPGTGYSNSGGSSGY